MDVEYFKGEFDNFLQRFTGSNNDKNNAKIIAPLTYQEILGAIKEVINSKIENNRLDSSQIDVKTPATGIIVTTPDAPDIPKMNSEHGQNGGIPGRFYSLDTLNSEKLKDSPIEQLILSETRPLSAKTENNDSEGNLGIPNDRDDERKDISKSSPSINTLVRSDTYVRENEIKNSINDNEFDEKNTLPEFPNNGNENLDFPSIDFNVPEFKKKLNILRDAASDVVKKIDDIEKVVPENPRPIRRLSTIGGFPGMNRACAASRTIQRPKMSRRSLTTFPGTPTSSRMSPTTDKTDLSNQTNFTAAPMINICGSRLSIPSTLRSVSSGSLIVSKKGQSPLQGSRLSTVKSLKTLTPSHRSVSSGAIKLSKKCNDSPSRNSNSKESKAPVLRTSVMSVMNVANDIQERPPKNPKYAHVQSTIPKIGTVLGKRKADEF